MCISKIHVEAPCRFGTFQQKVQITTFPLALTQQGHVLAHFLVFLLCCEITFVIPGNWRLLQIYAFLLGYKTPAGKHGSITLYITT